MSAALTDQEIDSLANDGCRNAAGGIYATRVYEFARAIEEVVRERLAASAPVQAAAEPVATVKITDAGYAQLWVHGICIKSLYGEVGRDAMDTLAARLNHATAQPVQAAALDSAMGHQTERDGEAVQRPLRGIER
jgi:hypothetical protein